MQGIEIVVRQGAMAFWTRWGPKRRTLAQSPRGAGAKSELENRLPVARADSAQPAVSSIGRLGLQLDIGGILLMHTSFRK